MSETLVHLAALAAHHQAPLTTPFDLSAGSEGPEASAVAVLDPFAPGYGDNGHQNSGCSGDCCLFFSYNYTPAGSSYHVNVLVGVVSAVLIMSMMFLSYRTAKAYISTYRSVRAWLEAAAINDLPDIDSRLDRARSSIHPSYLFFTSAVTFFFLTEAALLIPLSFAQHSQLNFLKYVLLLGHSFTDNGPLVGLYIRRLDSSGALVRAGLVNLLLGLIKVGALVMIEQFGADDYCFYCPSLYYPSFRAWPVYVVLTIMYSLAMLLHAVPVHWLPSVPRSRSPHLFIAWSMLVVFAYGMQALGELLAANGVDSGFCVLVTSVLTWTVLYAPLLYYVVIVDSRIIRDFEYSLLGENDSQSPLMQALREANRSLGEQGTAPGTETDEMRSSLDSSTASHTSDRGSKANARSPQQVRKRRKGGTTGGGGEGGGGGGGGSMRSSDPGAGGGDDGGGPGVHNANASLVGSYGSPGSPAMRALQAANEGASGVPLIDVRKLQFGKRIGIGGFGEVIRGTWLGADVAIKRLFPLPSNDVGEAGKDGAGGGGSADPNSDFIKEICIMNRMRHPHVIALLGAAIDSHNNNYIITPFQRRGSVQDLIRRCPDGVPLKTMVRILRQTASGLTYLHDWSPPVLHRDIKSHNVLLGDNNEALLCDFGLARFAAPSQTMTRIGTVQWAAPELLRDEHYNAAADVYSFGILMWEMAAGKVPYANMTQLKIAVDVAFHDLRPPVPSELDAEFSALMQQCWHRDARKRPSFVEVVEHLERIEKRLLRERASRLVQGGGRSSSKGGGSGAKGDRGVREVPPPADDIDDVEGNGDGDGDEDEDGDGDGDDGPVEGGDGTGGGGGNAAVAKGVAVPAGVRENSAEMRSMAADGTTGSASASASSSCDESRRVHTG